MTNEQFARYAMMVAAGESHNMAEVLATRKFPGTRTDVEFNHSRCNGNQFEALPQLGDWYRAEAERHGVNPVGQFYHSGLADYPGDPTAWIGGRGDAIRVAKEKGLRLSGLVDYDPGDRGYIPPDDIPLGEDILRQSVEIELEANPDQRLEDVVEKCYQKRTGQLYDEKPLLVQDSDPDSNSFVGWE